MNMYIPKPIIKKVKGANLNKDINQHNISNAVISNNKKNMGFHFPKALLLSVYFVWCFDIKTPISVIPLAFSLLHLHAL